MTGSDLDVVTTTRSQIRPPREADRNRFVALFLDPDFLVFYPDALTEVDAHRRFDHMVAVCRTIPFGKQPVIERSGGAQARLHVLAAGPGRR